MVGVQQSSGTWHIQEGENWKRSRNGKTSQSVRGSVVLHLNNCTPPLNDRLCFLLSEQGDAGGPDETRQTQAFSLKTCWDQTKAPRQTRRSVGRGRNWTLLPWAQRDAPDRSAGCSRMDSLGLNAQSGTGEGNGGEDERLLQNDLAVVSNKLI